MSITGKHDVAIVGGGIAGLTSGVRLAERGMRVIVLEKGEAERYPCNTRWSGGAFHICFQRIYEDETKLAARGTPVVRIGVRPTSYSLLSAFSTATKALTLPPRLRLPNMSTMLRGEA